MTAVESRRPTAHDERGLIGKLIVAWLVVASFVVLAGMDTASILLARYRTSDLAGEASFAAAEAFAATGNRETAVTAALAIIEEADGARLKRVDVLPSGEVKVVVAGHAGTLVVGRIGFLEDLAKVTATDTSAPSGP